jgi:hypothetical protein
LKLGGELVKSHDTTGSLSMSYSANGVIRRYFNDHTWNNGSG